MAKTSRERFQLTLDHKDPGKTVVDLGSTPITGIHADALDRLRRALHLPERTVRIEDPLQLLGAVDDDLRQALGLDIVGITPGTTLYGFQNKDWKPWKLQSGLDVEVPGDFNTTVDGEGRTYLYAQGDTSCEPAAMMPRNGYFFDNTVRGHIDYDDDAEPSGREDFFDDFGVYTDEQLRTIEERCNYYYNNTEYGLIGGGALAGFGDFAMIPGPSNKHPKGIRDIPAFMMAHYIFPDYIHEIFEYQLEIALKNAALFKQATGDKIQCMQISGTDFGMQTGPYMTLESYREFYKPYHKRINDWVHQNTNWKTFYHSCGSVVAFLPDFAEAGVDVLNPVQCSAAGMDPHMLKEQWGDRFVFWGAGTNTQQTLPFGTPEEVYKESYERLEIFSPNGGYVYNPIHNIQSATSAENMLAFFQAAKDFNQDR